MAYEEASSLIKRRNKVSTEVQGQAPGQRLPGTKSPSQELLSTLPCSQAGHPLARVSDGAGILPRPLGALSSLAQLPIPPPGPPHEVTPSQGEHK